MTAQPYEPLNADELHALAGKIQQQAEMMSPRERLLASEAIKSGLETSDEVQGYGMLTDVLEQEIAGVGSSGAEEVNQEEFRALRNKLAHLEDGLSPKEQAFMAHTFQQGVMAIQAGEVTGYSYLSLIETPYTPSCPDGTYWDSVLGACVESC